MSHNSLQAYYVTCFNVTTVQRAMTLTEFENLMPFERDLYISMIAKRNEELSNG